MIIIFLFFLFVCFILQLHIPAFYGRHFGFISEKMPDMFTYTIPVQKVMLNLTQPAKFSLPKIALKRAHSCNATGEPLSPRCLGA